MNLQPTRKKNEVTKRSIFTKKEKNRITHNNNLQKENKNKYIAVQTNRNKSLSYNKEYKQPMERIDKKSKTFFFNSKTSLKRHKESQIR